MQQVVNGAVLAAIYSLFAVGIGLPWATLDVLNLAHGSVFMFSAYTCYLVVRAVGQQLNLGYEMLIGIAAGAAMEMLLEIIVFRTIRNRVANEKQAELSMLIASVGVSGILVAIVAKLTSAGVFSLSSSSATGSNDVLGAQVTNLDIGIVIAGIAFPILVGVWLKYARTGRALRTIASDADTSRLMGIPSNLLSVLVLALSGASAGLAGVLLATYLSSIQATSGQDLLLKGFSVVVLGGIGSMAGALIGAVVLAAGETIVTATTSGVWAGAVSFAIIILVLVLRPNGLLGQIKVDRT